LLTPLSTQQQSTVEWICAGGGAGFGINVSLSLRFKGALSKPALERALALVMRRHEGLRSRVQRANGEVLQYFADPQDAIELPTVSVATLQEAEAHIGRRLAGRLDLECDGPLHAELLELSPQDHILVLIINHTATDTHADDLFISELLIAYHCYVRGDTPALAPAMSFSEYIAGELQAGTRLSDAQLQYWGGVIRGAVAPIPRRTTRVEEEATVRGRIIRVSTTAEVTRRLEEFAAASKVSLMAAVCAVIFLAVWREFALEDVCAFTIHSGRDSSRLKTLGASPGRGFLIRLALRNASCLTQLAKMIQTMLLRASIASRLPFTHDRALEQLSQQEASGQPQAAESPQPPGVHLGIIDAMRIKRSVPGTLQQLEVQRVMPGPLLNDPFQFDTAKTSAHPLDVPYIDFLNVLLRRDLASEPGEPLTFVGVFIDSALEENVVRSFLEQICAVAARVSPATQSLPLAQLLAQSDLQPT
jgi:Condensation domain